MKRGARDDSGGAGRGAPAPLEKQRRMLSRKQQTETDPGVLVFKPPLKAKLGILEGPARLVFGSQLDESTRHRMVRAESSSEKCWTPRGWDC